MAAAQFSAALDTIDGERPHRLASAPWSGPPAVMSPAGTATVSAVCSLDDDRCPGVDRAARCSAYPVL
jgi:hypothetical protein